VRDGLADHWAEILGPRVAYVNEGEEVGWSNVSSCNVRIMLINRGWGEKSPLPKLAKINLASKRLEG
jgi:hypothetical protein